MEKLAQFLKVKIEKQIVEELKNTTEAEGTSKVKKTKKKAKKLAKKKSKSTNVAAE